MVRLSDHPDMAIAVIHRRKIIHNNNLAASYNNDYLLNKVSVHAILIKQ